MQQAGAVLLFQEPAPRQHAVLLLHIQVFTNDFVFMPYMTVG
jgi:hypothetical protein